MSNIKTEYIQKGFTEEQMVYLMKYIFIQKDTIQPIYFYFCLPLSLPLLKRM